ncbi:MAG: lysine-sensitive aspartokinase 3 [Candidatus Kapaibacteriota bacterium]
MLVCKFGGTSVANSGAIRQVYSIMSSKEKPVFVVVSAFAEVTNQLQKIVDCLVYKEHDKIDSLFENLYERHYSTAEELGVANQMSNKIERKFEELKLFLNALKILGEVTPRSVDFILSIGELLSSAIIFQYFIERDLSICYVDPRQIIITDSNFTRADVNFELSKDRLSKFISENRNYDYYITGGFVGSNIEGHTTTLGRGGSDYSASIIASLLNAKKLEIWTDVDGIMTTDPNVVPNAKLLDEVSYEEASEMAIFGAKVLHPKTIFPAVAKKIPVVVRNTFNPNCNGTLITYKSPTRKVKAITFKRNVTVLNIISSEMLGVYGFLARVFDVFKRFQTEVDLVSTSEVSISLTIDDRKNLAKIIKSLKEFSQVEVLEQNAVVCIIGEGLKYSSTTPFKIFKALEGIKVLMVSMGASDINLSIVVKEKNLEKVIALLHKEFFY